MNPDTLTLIPATVDDVPYTFEAKRAAMGAYIAEEWGWDEESQLKIHWSRFKEKPFFIIVMDGKPVGTVSIQENTDHIRFGEFYIMPEYQRKGIGSTLLDRVLKEADEKQMPVRLEYLKWNPVGELYKRNGFEITHEDQFHYFMERKPNIDQSSMA